MHRVAFSGEGREYFGIWLTNLILTILTLGIYSAWAKVRTERYFKGATSIDGHAFGYHATPKQILIGRLIAVAVLAVIGGLQFVDVRLYVIALVCLGLAMPALARLSLRFNARVTSWRNIRFDFTGSVGRAYLVFALYPLAVPLSLGLAYPWMVRKAREYVINGHRYGDKAFAMGEIGNAIFGPFLVLWAIVLAFFVVQAVAPWAFGLSAFEVIVQFTPIVLFALYALGGAVLQAVIRNAVVSATRLDRVHRFGSDLPIGRYVGLLLANFALTALTLGLYLPFAQVRLAAFLAQHTTVTPAGALDDVVAAARPADRVGAAELADLEGFDVNVVG